MDKLKFVGIVILVEFILYFWITILWGGVMIPAVAVADNATSAASYPLVKGFIGASPLWLYIVPGFLGMVAIVIKLRSKT